MKRPAVENGNLLKFRMRRIAFCCLLASCFMNVAFAHFSCKKMMISMRASKSGKSAEYLRRYGTFRLSKEDAHFQPLSYKLKFSEITQEGLYEDFIRSGHAQLVGRKVGDQGFFDAVFTDADIEVIFFFDAAGKVQTFVVRPKTMPSSPNSTTDLLSNQRLIERFFTTVQSLGLGSKYVKENPEFRELEKVGRQLAIETDQKPIPSLDPGSLDAFRASTDGILLVEDVHGTLPTHLQLMEVLKTTRTDWISLEYHRDRQELFTTIGKAPMDSEQFRMAEDALYEMLQGLVWGSNWSKDEHPTLAVLRYAKENGIDVIARDISDQQVTQLREMGLEPTDEIGVAYRNLLWTRTVPPRGRGIVFGGADHFEKKPTFQDFYLDDHRARPLFLLKEPE